ncbi:unnamed protein product [Brassica napus]|uniref:(rape) hypothetical protein n=1 Tax=Brassica napus TaxID=3708 RepID=A0A816UX95_BRANA|nr:unnamed protein product [Brassica napus]
MKTFKISYFVVVLITVLAIAITLSEPLRVEASHRDRYGLVITATQGKKGGNRTSAMTCDKSPKVCRLKGSSGRDCCRKRDIVEVALRSATKGDRVHTGCAAMLEETIGTHEICESLFSFEMLNLLPRISGMLSCCIFELLTNIPARKKEKKERQQMAGHQIVGLIKLYQAQAQAHRHLYHELFSKRKPNESDRSFQCRNKPFVPLPSSLYTCCSSLAALKLKGESIFVDVPQSVNLPSLKTLKLRDVTYLNDDALLLLLSNCTALEDLFIDRYGEADDNVRALVVRNSTLQRLTLKMYSDHLDVQHVIVTPSLKYFKLHDEGHSLSYSIERMPKLEEADIDVSSSLDELLGSMTSVKRLSLRQFFNRDDESVLTVGAVFNQLEHVKLSFYSDDWSKLLVWLLRNSPKLRELNIYVDWNNRSSVPECLQNTLETFKFEGFMGTQEEGDFLSFFFKNASCLKSTSITDRVTQRGI